MDRCSICHSNTKYDIDQTGLIRIICPKCGTYRIDLNSNNTDVPLSKEDKFLFSGYLRNNSNENSYITISANTLKEINNIIFPYKNLSPTDKANKIIEFIGKSSKFIGHKVEIDFINDFTIFYCKNVDELEKLLSYLRSEGQISTGFFPKEDARYTHDQEKYFTKLELTFHGWEKYEKLKETNINSKKAFIAMNFDENLNSIFENSILPACIQCNFEAFRVDKTEHNEKICDKIIAEIKQSKFLIAEFTGQKHGVYFEAGFAYGLNIPVIWCCKKEDIDNLHFDTRQYNHIVWEDEVELKEKLINRIKATII